MRPSPFLPEKAESLLTDASNLTNLIQLAAAGLNQDAGAAIHIAASTAASNLHEAIQILRDEAVRNCGGAS